MPPQPTRYRIRVFKDNREVLIQRRYAAALDLTRGPGLRASAATLDELLLTLAKADGATGEQVRMYHLQVEAWPEGAVECHWPATVLEGP